MVEKLTPERRREMTRNTLLEAAAEVFAEKGFGGASLEEIAERAGFTRGAIYKHFSSKEELFECVTDAFDDVALASFGPELLEHSQLGDLNAASIAAVWKDLFSDDNLQKVIALEARLYSFRHPDVRERWNEFRNAEIERITGFIDEILAPMGIQLTMSTETLARTMYAASDGIAMLTLVEPDAHLLFEPLIELVIRGMATMIAE